MPTTKTLIMLMRLRVLKKLNLHGRLGEREIDVINGGKKGVFPCS